MARLQHAFATVLYALGCYLASGVLLTAHAEDRALLIGVGDYHYASIKDLPGIDLDIQMMSEVAKMMRFDTIKVLQDNEARLANVEKELTTGVMQGLAPEDRVLIYFSGHGTRVQDSDGDEQDGIDEVLMMHDTAPVRQGNKTILTNALLDDHFNRLLSQLPSANKLVLIDACHSGTATKSLPNFTSATWGDIEPHVKFFAFPDMPNLSVETSEQGKGPKLQSNLQGFAMSEQKQEPKLQGNFQDFVTLAAAQDNQRSLASPNGSFFTLALYSVLRDVAQEQQNSVTAVGLRDVVESILAKAIPASNMFNPQVTGRAELIQRPLLIQPLRNGYGPQWQELAGLVKEATPLPIEINQNQYAGGDVLIISVTVPQPGYLNVIHVDPNDDTTILFPNQFNPENKVSAGKLVIPTEQMTFDLKAHQPYGPSLIAAVVTNERLNLYQAGQANRDSKGRITDLFSKIQPANLKSLRSFKVEQRQNPFFAAGMVETKVCARLNSC
jgi:hypothetical protein